jgi:hypothetical protein
MHKEGKVLEIRPRSGRWYPFRILVPAAERPKLKNAVTGPKGYVPGATITASAQLEWNGWAGIELQHAIDPLNSAFATFDEVPSKIRFGSDQLYEIVRK